MEEPETYFIELSVTFSRGISSKLCFSSSSKQWNGIAEQFRTGSNIEIPKDQFHYQNKVLDEIAFQWEDDELKPINTLINSNTKLPSPTIVVVLESPHRYEYSYNNGCFTPIRPLNRQNSRSSFAKKFIKLLEPHDITANCDSIIFCNPVQFQTSLFRLMDAKHQSNLQTDIRNETWMQLYGCKYNELLFIRNDFIARISRYDPRIIINACTQQLQPYVTTSLLHHKDRLYISNAHASMLWRHDAKITHYSNLESN